MEGAVRTVRASAIVVAALLVALVGSSSPLNAAATSRKSVVASFYPLAYAAGQVGGSRVKVENLTPAGAEPHDLELTPAQIDDVLDAAVVLHLGRGFQPAVEDAASQRDGVTLELLDALPGVKPSDPHVWLDPVLMSDIVSRIQRSLTNADPSGKAVYAANAGELRLRLRELDARYRAELAECDRRLIVTAHEAFGYLARRYGLRQEGAAGLSPDAEPDPKRLADLADLAEREHVTVIFAEELVSPRIAETLARDVGVRTEVLNPLEGLSEAERKRGADYFKVMDANLAKLRDALGCSQATGS
jgi:zinc transport system substrate-binding protein